MFVSRMNCEGANVSLGAGVGSYVMDGGGVIVGAADGLSVGRSSMGSKDIFRFLSIIRCVFSSLRVTTCFTYAA